MDRRGEEMWVFSQLVTSLRCAGDESIKKMYRGKLRKDKHADNEKEKQNGKK